MVEINYITRLLRNEDDGRYFPEFNKVLLPVTDIALKNEYVKNLFHNADIYRSISYSKYKKITFEDICDKDKLILMPYKDSNKISITLEYFEEIVLSGNDIPEIITKIFTYMKMVNVTKAELWRNGRRTLAIKPDQIKDGYYISLINEVCG